MATNPVFYTWKGVIAALRKKIPGAVAHIPISRIAHPLDARMRPTVAASVGQHADFKLVLDSEKLLYVREFERHYEAELYSVITVPEPKPRPKLKPKRESEPKPASASEPEPEPEPESESESESEERFVAAGANASNAIGNAARDEPALMLVGTTAVGALLGAALGSGQKDAAAGAIIGCCVGLAAIALATAETSPATAQLSKELFHSVVTNLGRQQATRSPINRSAPTTGLPQGRASGRKSSKPRMGPSSPRY